MPKLAIIDDYQNVALRLADWSGVAGRCEVDVFTRPFASVDAAAEALGDYDIVSTLRERTAFPAALIERLPNLKLIAVTGPKHRTLDLDAASRQGIAVCNTTNQAGGRYATPELTFGLILSLFRHIPSEAAKMRRGGWQSTIGRTLEGKTLGLVGVGRIGSRVAHYGRAFDMEVIAWSPNLTEERAAAAGARSVTKEALFAQSDVVSMHLVLGETTRGIVGADLLGLMKPDAYLVNTARGPLVEESALVEALGERRIAGAGLDVFEPEPLPDGHRLRTLDNVILTPHLGYTVEESLRAFYEATVENIAAWLDGAPIRIVNADATGANATGATAMGL